MLFRGLIATNFSGALDGLIAARNSGGAYFRNRTTPTDPNTSRQIYMRSALNAAYLNWLDLSPEQRAGWEAYARTVTRTNRIGDARHHSGWNEFVRAYTYRAYAINALPLSIPPTLSTISSPEAAIGGTCTGSIAVGDGNFTFSFDDTAAWHDGSETNALLLELSGVRTAPGVIEITPYPPTRNFFKGPWQLVTGIVDTDGPPITVALTRAPTQYERVFWRARVTTLLHGLSGAQYGVAIAP